MIELSCSCGKKNCPNKIRLHGEEHKYFMVDHALGGTDQLIHTSAAELRRFAKKILRACLDDRKKKFKL